MKRAAWGAAILAIAPGTQVLSSSELGYVRRGGMRLYELRSTIFVAALSIFPLAAETKILFSNVPATGANLFSEAFLIGNGRLGAIPFGQPSREKLSLNHEALWTGGPFEDPAYRGGNPGSSTFANVKKIRDAIFQEGAGNVGSFGTADTNYGSFRVMANLSISIDGVKSYTGYKRSLDLTTGAHTTTFTAQDQRAYTTVTYCSYPAQVCFYRLSVNQGTLPNIAIGLENQLEPATMRNITCNSGLVRLHGFTVPGGKGMEYDVIARLSTGPLGAPIASCDTSTPGTLVVTGSSYGPAEPLTSLSLVVGAQTEYDQARCNAQNAYSCRGAKPGPVNERITAAASTKLESKMFVTHQQDYQKLMGQFNLTLHDPWAKSQYPSETLELSQLLSRYRATAEIQRRSLQADGELGEPPAAVKRQTNQPWTPVDHSKDAAVTVTATNAFPSFQFPTILPEGAHVPKDPIPWSTAGTVVVTDLSKGTNNPQLFTVTMTVPAATPAPSATPASTAAEPNTVVREKVTHHVPRQVKDGRDAPEAADGGSYVESALFDYARHLFISSSRENSLPPNLQGVWTDTIQSAWSADYHANINLQMNYGFANQVGFYTPQQALWRFMKDTWVPRGKETAKLIYDAPGWVLHNEINIFGHTGMKNNATWANYPVAAAWMMQQVYDYYDYTRELPFLQQTGYQLIRDVSNFWLSQLQEDQYSKDKTLVANPCNSPEIGPTTLGCAHFQQLIHQLFDTTLSAGWAVNDADQTFIASLKNNLATLDKGFRIGSWGQIKEWKIPETKLRERRGDTHRHLSQLVGWYPGYSIASFQRGYANPAMQNAVAITLRSRGSGLTPPGSPDGNAGWPKLQRAAAWALLNDTAQADFHLRLAIATNFAANGLSHYNGMGGPFQIDANFGVASAMLAMLVVDLPAPYGTQVKRDVILGPAIPRRWGPGNVVGLRIRGGTVLDMSWNAEGMIDKVNITMRGESARFFTKKGRLIGEI